MRQPSRKQNETEARMSYGKTRRRIKQKPVCNKRQLANKNTFMSVVNDNENTKTYITPYEIGDNQQQNIQNLI